MQLSEKYRRGIVVPLDDAAASALDREEFDESTRVHVVDIGSQTDFDKLWKTGFFGVVNEQTGRLIDDYEEEVVPAEMVARVRRVAESFVKKGACGSAESLFFQRVVEACTLAERDGRPLYFVL